MPLFRYLADAPVPPPPPRPPLWHDLRAGALVALIALPLSLGIAMASGFPPVAGLLTAIVGGALVSLLGSARLTIKGPAAGLIVIALASVQELGAGDHGLGYRRTLGVLVVAAALQIGMALLRAASYGIVISPSVVQGMLAAIGVIIVSKQVHTLVGVSTEADTPLGLLAEIPHSVANANPEILVLGVTALLVLFGWPRLRVGRLRRVPAALVALLVTIPLATWFELGYWHSHTFLGREFLVGPDFLVTLPGSLLDAVTLPDFAGLASAAGWKFVVMFALIGSIESTLSVLAVDAMDSSRHPSNLDRDLLATGTGNLVCAIVGGLPMISEIVRSRANIDAGAGSSRANLTHGVLLLIAVALIPELLHRIPLATLAAMLVYTGVRLASPGQLVAMRRIGPDQLALFATTLLVTLATDLLIGVGAGLLLLMLQHLWHGASLRDLFQPRIDVDADGDTMTLGLRGTATFTSLLAVRKEIRVRPAGTRRVVVDLERVGLVDHTFLNRLQDLARSLGEVRLEVTGHQRLDAVSAHPLATRRQRSG
ncbi:MAG: SulP family inorganic anion transporter [Planctomycetes bacterium]|nr:SulP family inorganic anion transporter [Planctomycetota bacterium]